MLVVHKHVCFACCCEVAVNESDAAACNWNVVMFCSECIRNRWRRFKGTCRAFAYMFGIKRYSF